MCLALADSLVGGLSDTSAFDYQRGSCATTSSSAYPLFSQACWSAGSEFDMVTYPLALRACSAQRVREDEQLP